MEIFQKYKLHNVIYGLTIGITILLFFFSKGEIDTPQIEKEPTEEKKIDDVSRIEGDVTPASMEKIIESEQRNKEQMIKEMRDYVEHHVHNVETFFAMIFILILSSLYIYSSISLEKQKKQKEKISNDGYIEINSTEDSINEENNDGYYLLQNI